VPNRHLISAVVQGMTAEVFAFMPVGTFSADPRSELDSHANMVVLGKHAFIFESSGRTCNVRPFSEELGIAENVPIFDGAIAYDCPFSSKSYIPLFRNALSIPSMKSNLIPPFIMWVELSSMTLQKSIALSQVLRTIAYLSRPVISGLRCS
jgi:hypothetical protein